MRNDKSFEQGLENIWTSSYLLKVFDRGYVAPVQLDKPMYYEELPVSDKLPIMFYTETRQAGVLFYPYAVSPGQGYRTTVDYVRGARREPVQGMPYEKLNIYFMGLLRDL